MSGLPLFFKPKLVGHGPIGIAVRRRRPAYTIPPRVLVQLCAIGANDRDSRQREVLQRLLRWMEGR